MAQGEWASAIRLGTPGSELDISGEGFKLNPPFNVGWGRMEAVNTNLRGERFSRVLRRYEVTYDVRISHISADINAALLSMQNVDNLHLSFLFADQWKLNSERYVMPDGGISLTMDSNPFLRLDRAYYELSPTGTATTVIDGVYSTPSHKGAQATAGTLFTSFNRATWGITLNATQTSGGVVYVNSLYNGAYVRIKRMSSVMSPGFESNVMRYWNVAMQLEGV